MIKRKVLVIFLSLLLCFFVVGLVYTAILGQNQTFSLRQIYQNKIQNTNQFSNSQSQETSKKIQSIQSIQTSKTENPLLKLNPKTDKIPKSLPQFKIPVLMYHHIGSWSNIPSSDKIGLGLRVSPVVFESQLKYLVENNYTTISNDDLLESIFLNKKLPTKPIILTFDDGYRNAYTTAFPLLKKYKMIGEFAIITGVVGTNAEYVNWQELLEMKNEGMKFSSHTALHCPLASLDTKNSASGKRIFLPTPDGTKDIQKGCSGFNNPSQLNKSQIEFEILESKKILQEKLGIKINTLIYPYGNYNNQVIEILKNTNLYFFAYTVEPAKDEVLDISTNQFSLPRYRISGQDTLPINGFFAGNR